jgi:hypothetical protein
MKPAGVKVLYLNTCFAQTRISYVQQPRSHLLTALNRDKRDYP